MNFRCVNEQKLFKAVPMPHAQNPQRGFRELPRERDLRRAGGHCFMVEEGWADESFTPQTSHYAASTFYEALQICDATPRQRRIKGIFLVHRANAVDAFEYSRVVAVEAHAPYGMLCRLEGGLAFITKLHGESPTWRAPEEVSLVGVTPGVEMLEALDCM